MTDISTGNLDPDDRDADRDTLPVTQVDEEEVAKHSGTTTEAPSGEGSGIGGEPTPLPPEDDEPRDA